MKYLNELAEGDRISAVYLCKKAATLTTKNGKDYMSLTLMDKTANADAKIWEPNSEGIGDFDELDYIYVSGDVTVFNGAIHSGRRRTESTTLLTICRCRRMTTRACIISLRM